MVKGKLPRLKKKLDKIFSEYVRLRDADQNGNCVCCTCGEIGYWASGLRGMHAGHFHGKKGKARYDEQQVHAQCYTCNMVWDRAGQKGRPREYTIFMSKRYGQKTVDRILKEKFEVYKLRCSDIEEMINHYEDQIEKLKEEKGLD